MRTKAQFKSAATEHVLEAVQASEGIPRFSQNQRTAMSHGATPCRVSPQATPTPVPPGVKILFIDDHLLVLDKPAGLLAVPGRGDDKQDCLSARVQAQYPDALIVHRLDMATSGLLVMARGIEAQRRLSLAFEQRRVHKRYTAVVEGRLPPPAACPDRDVGSKNPPPQTAFFTADESGWASIDLPLVIDWLARPRSKVDPVIGKPSLTRWRVATAAAPLPASTRLDLEPVTGRSHQLRVHLQAIGHPIVGDPLYAPPHPSVDRLLLHAQSLTLPHPQSGEPVHFASPCPF